MNILQNAGTHKILRITENPLQLIEECGRTAYQSQDKITEDSTHKFVKRLMDRGHASVLEHAVMTVRFDNVSIGFTRELNRHRLISVTEKSTRYVSEEEFAFIMPPDQEIGSRLCDFLEESENLYGAFRKNKWPAEDARQFLPIAIKSQIVCTTNFREWHHILNLRTQKQAHWEIRRVMIQLLADVRSQIPIVFDDIGPEFTKKEAEDWGWNVIATRPMSDWVAVSL